MNFNLTEILDQLKKLGSKERALQDKRYHKSERLHWGVPVPASISFAKALIKNLSPAEALSLAQALWATDYFDPMICSAKILSQKMVKPSRALWDTLVNFLEKVDGWALEDQLAPVAWKCIHENEDLLDEVEKWTTHPSFWFRRAALVYTLPYAKPGKNPDRMLKWAASYADDPEWFIQKAIGWWLRVLGEHAPEKVHPFLSENGHMLRGVAKREATRKLSALL